MSYALSRLMSAATASYAGYCFYDPGHLGRALGADSDEQAGYDLLAEVFGVRDLAISTFGVLGRSDRTVRTAMWIRIACDVGDGLVLASRTDDDAVRGKVLATTMTWGALNYLALRADKRRARKVAAAKTVAGTAAGAVGAVVDKVT
ncbi:hypothetical protein [Nocardioides nanhaiensis]|uniref:Uncharacterized protein n=1 Tax=Nocardioides nanhaiensis TaxID=1476871 RepID=A0ABP8VTB0_9ACTN